MDHQKAFSTNRETWNARTMLHYNSGFYDKSAFAKARNSLNHYEQRALGDITGKSLLHLQCHFGQDSLSWVQKGAIVTGVDISDTAIDLARNLSEQLELPATFECCNVLDTSYHIKNQFDIVFTSYGVIGWLPDLKPWAQMIAQRLKKGGQFYMVEFHPIAWMFDYQNTPPTISYHYANKEVIHEEYQGSYAVDDKGLDSNEYSWNHSLSEVVQSLIDAGLQITTLAEHDGSPYNIFPGMHKKDDLYYLKDQLYPTIFEILAVLP
ncbi:Methyltransferase domain-containing protein [Nonlabens sp. Hel1_33_55]|uniref:class I SAM-dependent methyltransferase n=1 Tax=Nonlabens sp. Hel1_33_55 TaxID=1336802 RepID=UPI000875C398|nr:class I SAM-dependent methyltransferase [Nonlabens sp. Hel1_33_55]SCX91470.1 Methyltransferase domain-containing protein [Nonlabens sp. Hel1_33_55]